MRLLIVFPRWPTSFLKKSFVFLWTLACALTVLFTLNAFAQNSPSPKGVQKFSFQGSVTDIPDGNYDMQVRIHGGTSTFTGTVPQVAVQGGIFSIVIDETILDGNKTLSAASFYDATSAADVKVDVTILNEQNVIDEFTDIPLTTVGNAFVAQTALSLAPGAKVSANQIVGSVTAAVSSRAQEAVNFTGTFSGDLSGGQTTTTVNKLQGVALDLGGSHAEGDVLKFQNGKLSLGAGGNQGVNFTAGNGLLLKDGQLSVVTGTGGGQIPQLDANGKLPESILPSLTSSALAVGGESGFVKLEGGRIPFGLIDATSLGLESINGSHIAPGSIGLEHLNASLVASLGLAGEVTRAPAQLTNTRSCPSGYILISGNSRYGTSDFCIMQYEAKGGMKGVEAKAQLAPITNVSQDTARSLCQNVGTGYALVNDAEWMTLASSITAQAKNWSSGIVGSGRLKNDRSLFISNEESVSDLAGGVWEWVDWIIDTSGRIATASHTEFTDISIDTPAMPFLSWKPAGSWNSQNGIGQIFSSDSVSYRFAGAVRGGNNASPGIFSLRLDRAPSSADSDIGFRCVYRR